MSLLEKASTDYVRVSCLYNLACLTLESTEHAGFHMHVVSTLCLERLTWYRTILHVSRAAHLSGLELNLRIIVVEGHQRETLKTRHVHVNLKRAPSLDNGANVKSVCASNGSLCIVSTVCFGK